MRFPAHAAAVLQRRSIAGTSSTPSALVPLPSPSFLISRSRPKETTEAMVLACIDPRIQEPVHRYTVEQNLTGKFSQFVIAGAAIGVVAPAFKDWHKAFWDNLATTIQLHRIKRVIAIDHRDCGAAR